MLDMRAFIIGPVIRPHAARVGWLTASAIAGGRNDRTAAVGAGVGVAMS
jgi:hypothetical protein